MLIIILVLLLLSMSLFYYTNCLNKKTLREGIPVEATITDPIILTSPMGIGVKNSPLGKFKISANANVNSKVAAVNTNTNTTTLSDDPNRHKLDINPMVLAKHNASNIASLSTQIKALTDVNVRVRQAATDVKALNGRFNDLAPLRKRSLENAANLASLTKVVTPLVRLKQTVADLTVKANTNSKALLNLGKAIQKFQTQPINNPSDLNATLGT